MTQTFEALAAELARVERAGRVLDRCLWLVAAGAVAFAAVGVALLGVRHGVPVYTAWGLDPLVAITLVAILLGDAVLGRHGVKPGGWAALLRITTGTTTLALNVWQSVADRDPTGVVLHAVAPMLLILLAEAAPRYRDRFVIIAGRLQAEIDRQVAETARAEREAADARYRAETEAAQAERDRRRAERDKPARQSRPPVSPQSRSPGRPRPASRLAEVGAAERLMRDHWDRERAAGRTPSGADLDRVAGTANYGRRLRRQWLAEAETETEASTETAAV